MNSRYARGAVRALDCGLSDVAIRGAAVYLPHTDHTFDILAEWKTFLPDREPFAVCPQ